MDLFADQGEWITINNGLLYWHPQFLNLQQSEQYFQQLKNELNWQQEHITLFGRSVLQPRLQTWLGDAVYTYSGLTMHPQPWTSAILDLKAQCEQQAKTSFNSVLGNLYRDGEDYMGWHQDNERELGHQPVIASLSFGVTRQFVFKHKTTKEKIAFQLTPGSLLIMAGETQQYWQHALPKTKRVNEPRINLTFRYINQ
ncbi:MULTISPECIES: alpha-ketoglutarate-dependent dioxygenase AlkB [unclassified Photobacterium]|uniref:alpha-ketoglutarate-dependent dioxygenase AlkB family protein n=1 Tax=unclassified Photobacterium TaxID=2628852 RepID=UPI000D179EC8|nr:MULTISPECIES: alpha-ketoglutarate-dependent dioxygenase AlkB [unclassified Photobacterium]PSV34605.1 alpha-ketoglutarate-dependent dioxygenase AlkB [Photobacterium sp. GB-210]PSV37225.1 alpha-ketoglutarate-dependent dioxygenase AlkB [Photobacterium sp. GB-27]PSV44579.1 alpha-ketoglutarate-dependent dioxygenase AlkB [Photobacterium sp. GB-36]PSV53546.1 alpha-ketoglutarate-dependent dioxygenase AlkB [Photobacterium sp. GB-3]PSV53786.1 alpha-ketoglutarate-dependent dioxygenase AlkB [Photobacte